ncbi:lamin tail domain-containing protein, partial [bacterium]|nr:lamin tail domain-containing protein [bacterium]
MNFIKYFTFRFKFLLFSVTFLTIGFSNGVVINEVHYNPSLNLGFEDSDYEFIELYNYTDNDIDITGWSLLSTEIHYQFGHYILEAGEYALLCRNADTYEGCIDYHDGALYNDGEQLYLLDAHHNMIDYILYDDGQDANDEFPPQADAEGSSIELIDPSLAFGNDGTAEGSDWQASYQINGTPGYQNSNGGDLEPDNNIAFGAFCDSKVEILYNSNIDIAGFQFDLTGLTIENTFGGAAEDADFSVSNSGSTVIGFSFEGNIIPAGEGLLLMVNTNGIAGEQCIDNIIVSDSDGNTIQSSPGECTYLLLEEECINCDDELACNFGADTSCEYPEDNFDCEGNCNVEEDCNGDCGGNAIIDDCGVCGGYNVDLDCNGDCFGDAVVDECGLCGGDDSSCTASLEFGAWCDMSIEILYSSFTDVAGFQFAFDNISIGSTFGGIAEESGFSVSNSEGIVIGFSLEGNTIPAGQGVLTNLEVLSVNPTPSCFEEIIISDTDGNPIQSEAGECADLWDDFWNNGDCPDYTLNNFTNLPDPTGLNHLVVIEDILGLEVGDEIGLFDASGLLSSQDCTDEYGEILVGAGVYDGSQMNIVGVGSLDFCDFPDGYQLSGWVEDNPIMIKVWDASQNYEYVATQYSFETGGEWNELFSTIMEIDANIYGC